MWVGEEVFRDAVLCAQFCCDPKTALKNKFYLKEENLGFQLVLHCISKSLWKMNTLIWSLLVHECSIPLHYFSFI